MHKADAFCDFLRMRNNAASLNETDSIRHIIEHSIFHAYAVCALGTICNFAALWCIVTCDKTNAAVKFLLFCIFLSLLLLSLLTRPLLSLNMSTFLKEDVKPVPEVLNVAVCILYILLAEGEMWCIAAVAFFRGSAIWSARRRKLTLSAAVKVVAFLYVFIILSNFGMGYLLLMEHFTVIWVVVIYSVFHIFSPMLVTVGCYGAMIVVVQRNKRQLLSVDGKPSPTLDRATHAIMAVLILNLAIGLPHTVYHFLPTTTVQEDIFFHTLFSCHFFVDPVVFLGFNRSYRNRITGVLCACVSRVLGICAKAMPVHDAQGRMRDEFFHTHVQGAAENVEMAVQIRDTHRPSDET
ncbi:uncharacterized protein [Macrobrachium rosenbergii]|uniref:uncharacterized protein isoform X1 n=1 Tax=Macrobrachium rosenbergii TaxID=79674 RepID=UPI0034D7107C